jgi:hypothetical protein
MNTAGTSQNGTLTSLAQLFDHSINGTEVKAIEIPLFQRDYAQGRKDAQVRQVRERFLADLCAALEVNGKELHLDFVFGDVVNGTLYPLDGQQRLTTLFLLHCYLAWQQPQGSLGTQPWHSFHYATRPGARAFCEFLTRCQPDMCQSTVSEWLCDQADYLPTWKHDPTIQGMLVVLDALHAHYRGKQSSELAAAWQRLIDLHHPAIRFLLLTDKTGKLNHTLYVKMNSRGRPLTEFENFKADLEALLQQNFGKDDAAVKDFSHKIDTDWADLFWKYRGENDLIDEECMRYLRFLFEVRAWKHRFIVKTDHNDLRALTLLSESLLGRNAPSARTDFEWIVRALDVWMENGGNGIRKPKDISALFSQIFTRQAHPATTPLRVFNFGAFDSAVGVDLFHACCVEYGTRSWSLAHTVLFYGVLCGLMNSHLELSAIHSRLRLLRNLIEASRNEIRADDTRNNMPDLLQEVEIIMTGEPLGKVKTFNQVQVRNEQAKQEFLSIHPHLRDDVCKLEDHELLRGGLTAFDLDPKQSNSTFQNRATQFHALFFQPYHQVSAALVAKGNRGRGYHKHGSGYWVTYLGAPKQTALWEDHWRLRYNETTHPSGVALMGLLDEMAVGKSPQAVIDAFIQDPLVAKDWRYYIAKYEVMRGAHRVFAGTYFIAPDHGYAICLPKSDSCDNRSYHHDAYLLALVETAGIPPGRIDNEGWPRCFPGDETQARYLTLRQSGLKVRCVARGWLLDTSNLDQGQQTAFAKIAIQLGIQKNTNNPSEWDFDIAQKNGVDTEDRIVKGAELMRNLIACGM